MNVLTAVLKPVLRPVIVGSVSLLQSQELSPRGLLTAYREGRFPLPGRFGRVAWQTPEWRAVMPFDRFHMPKSLARLVRQEKFEVTFDQAFDEVIDGCAEINEFRRFTWLTPQLVRTYKRLHRQGYAHSTESWSDGKLAGGRIGLTIGGLYTGGSAFHRVNHASKVALVYLIERLRTKGFQLYDMEIKNQHTARFGCIEIPRAEFQQQLAAAVAANISF